ncbi:MAG: flagellar biosynthesis protein FlhF [Planctomycetota bacterium]
MSFELTRVEAPTMGEALQKVRAALGDDALIVSSRKIRRGGVLGVGGEEIFEVYAAGTRSRIRNVQREQSSRSRPADPAAPPEAPAPGEISGTLLQVREEIREYVAKSTEREGAALPFLRECYELLVSHDVESRVAQHLVDQIADLRPPSGLPDASRVRAMVRAQLVKLFHPSPPLEEKRRPRTLVLVGPTGVGKTTTIAKLAARARLMEKRKVGLITIDTFRIAGVDQLEKYAQIIGLPLFVATTPEELRLAREELRAEDADAVYVDSAGRSQRDELKMTELREFVSVLPDAEVHLVVSATTHGRTMLSIANRFESVGFDRLILTKVDETISFGSLVGALVTIGRPVSYLTDGQEVPDDIVASDPERLADLVLRTNAL